jgi:NTP pyrophosphatase (non-canonical NTP hydrolase)
MRLAELQSEVEAWTDHNFGHVKGQPALALLKTLEELGELAHHYVTAEDGVRVGEDHEAGKVDAVGDVVIALTVFCVRSGIDLENAVLDTWAKVSKRDWKSDPVNGQADRAGGA